MAPRFLASVIREKIMVLFPKIGLQDKDWAYGHEYGIKKKYQEFHFE
jgi:hypothetical protein